jgi:hypothetical protein
LNGSGAASSADREKGEKCDPSPSPLPVVRLYPMQPSRDISRLIEIMAALRRPGTGCGWDIAQTFETIPYTIEEA